MKFKAELYYKDKKIAEGDFEEERFAPGLPGPEGNIGTHTDSAFSVRWKEADKVKK